MSRGSANNFTPRLGSGYLAQPGQVYGAHQPENDPWNYTQPVIPRFAAPYRATPLNDRGPQDEWWPSQERVVPGPSGFARIPPPPPTHAPMQIILMNNGMARPRIPEAPPRLSSQLNMPQAPLTQEDSLLTQHEQTNALNKLKKEIYNPTPKRMIQRINLYYRDNAAGTRSNDKQKELDDDGKRCAICLDDFEPKQAVTLTPCDHMFHEECIVPWVKSHGQCPVCRFVISEQVRQRAVTSNANGVNIIGGDLFAGDLVSIIRAMEAALQLRTRAFR
ncbi:hypothetical protein LguiB_002201 [Lonicera macranthoides]